MALAKYEREKEFTLGQGNCAFNAFTLALCDSAVFSQIERSLSAANENIDARFHQFIFAAAVSLDVDPNWAAVKKELLRLREHDKSTLQYKISPVLRQLTADIAAYSPDAVFIKSGTVSQFVGTYHDYERKKMGKQVTAQDDMFSRHTFITDKFYEVYYGKEKDKLQRKKIIENWWWNEGYDKFLQEMRKDSVWAGDLELGRLAKYFNVVLEVIPEEGFLYNIYGDYGYFPFLDDKVGREIPKNDRNDVIEILRTRMVVERGHEHVHEAGINFSVSNLWNIIKRLEKIPNYKQVMEFMTQQSQLKGVIVPQWPRACLDELIQRNVIGRHKNGKDYIFAVDTNEALQRINEIPHIQAVSDICRKYFKALPTLVLHKSPDHWSNTLKIISPEELAAKKKIQEQMSRYKPDFFNTSVSAQVVQRFTNPLRKSAESVVKGKS